MPEHQQDIAKADIPTRPLKLKLKLLEKKSHISTDIVSFKFARRSEDVNQKQRDHDYSLNYKAGQYAVLDLGTKEDPEGPIRSFTLASSPTEENFILISTRIRDTLFKKKLASLDVGISVTLTAPLGKFVLHEDYSKTAVFLSGGIGVTPFRSMIKYATDKQLPVKITMFDSNRNEQNILYKDEFNEWVDTNKNLKIVFAITEEDGEKQSSTSSWTRERGRIDKEMLTKHLSSDEVNHAIFYVCGPPAMLNAMKSILEDELRITKERIKVEEFIGY